jgi:hypothetical protein
MTRTIRLMALAGLCGLAACAGNSGNPNGAAYAGDPGGVIAAAPQWNGPPVAYDPYGPLPVSDTMRIPPYNSGISPAPR